MLDMYVIIMIILVIIYCYILNMKLQKDCSLQKHSINDLQNLINKRLCNRRIKINKLKFLVTKMKSLLSKKKICEKKIKKINDNIITIFNLNCYNFSFFVKRFKRKKIELDKLKSQLHLYSVEFWKTNKRYNKIRYGHQKIDIYT